MEFDLGLPEIKKLKCRFCGRMITEFIVPFDFRGYLCKDQRSCMELVSLQRAVASQ